MVEFRALGSLELKDTEGQELRSVLAQTKRVALLAYLAVAIPRGFHRRDKLLALFWPELDDQHARHSLNQAVYALRSSLGEEALVSRGDEEVGVNEERFWCDVAAFEAALAAGRPEEALELYRGDLLEGFHISEALEFERWLEVERGRLRERAAEAAWALAETKEAEGNAVEATRWARRAAALSPDDEGVLRRLVVFLDRIGDRSAAIRAYEAFAWRLAEEYELEPSPETKEVIEAVRARAEPSRRPVGEPAAGKELGIGEPVPVSAELPPIERLMKRLKGLRLSSLTTRRGLFLGLLLFVGLVVLGTGIAVLREGLLSPAYAVDNPRQSYVIFPFSVTADDLGVSWLAEGAANMLTIDLEGWREIRVVDRRRVAAVAASRSVSREDDIMLDDALAVARDLRVGTLILGDVVGQAGTVQIIVRLYDVGSGEPILDPVQVEGSAEEDLRPLFDQIAARILDLSGAPVISPDLRAATSTSLDAYREYLDGLNYLYRWQLDEAVERFRSAVSQDSMFALAYHRLALAMSWNPPLDEAERREISAAAVRYADRLPWRQRQHVLAASAFYNEDLMLARRLYGDLIAADSSDAEAWYQLGDVEYHDDSLVHTAEGDRFPRINLNTALHGFLRAVELDPRFHLGYGHAFDILDLPTSYLYTAFPAEQTAQTAYFKAVWQDSMLWVPIDPRDPDAVISRYWSDSVNNVLRGRAITLAQRWSRAAPDESRPHFVLRDIYVEAGSYGLALDAQRALLRVEGDTTHIERILLGALYLANGVYDTAVVHVEAGLAAGPQERPPRLAAGVFIAGGRPSRAIEGLAWIRPAHTSSWVPTPEGGGIPWGDSQPLLAQIQILGSTGADRRELRAALDSLRRMWSARYEPEELELLSCAQTDKVAPALLLLGHDAVRDWIASFGTPITERCRKMVKLDAWQSYLQLEADSPAAASRSLDLAIAQMEQAFRPPRPFDLYLLAGIAQTVGRHPLAVDLYARMDSSMVWRLYSARTTTGYNWGLVSLSYFRRARSYEFIGDTELAAQYYERFLDVWKDAEPDLQHFNDEARDGLERLVASRATDG